MCLWTMVCCATRRPSGSWDTFEKHLHLPVTKIDDADRMMRLLKVLLDEEGTLRCSIGTELGYLTSHASL